MKSQPSHLRVILAEYWVAGSQVYRRIYVSAQMASLGFHGEECMSRAPPWLTFL